MRSFLSIIALLTCGCAHHGQKVFDETHEVGVAALRFMLSRSASKSAQTEFSAFVVSKEYASYFATLRPPVIAFDETRFSSDTFVDRVTGGHVMIWSVSHVEIHGDTAVCDVAWQSGNRAAGRHAVYLRKRGNWVAEREEALWITQKPNKAPEPTTFAVTSRATVLCTDRRARTVQLIAARAAPAKVVAHL